MLTARGTADHGATSDDEQVLLLGNGDASRRTRATSPSAKNNNSAGFELLRKYPQLAELEPIVKLIVQCLLSTVAPVGFVVFALGVVHTAQFADTTKRIEVDREHCTMTCWDKAFKGSYGTDAYKSVYFNYDEQVIPIFWAFVFYSNCLTAASMNALRLLKERRLDFVWAAVFMFQVYPSFYNWWVLFNYRNDRYFTLYRQQLAFAYTEFLSTVCTCLLAVKHFASSSNTAHSPNDSVSVSKPPNLNTAVAPKPLTPLYIVAVMSMMHVYVASADEIMKMFGSFLRTSRWIFLSMTDAVPLFASLYYIHRQHSVSLAHFSVQLLYLLLAATVCVLLMPPQKTEGL